MKCAFSMLTPEGFCAIDVRLNSRETKVLSLPDYRGSVLSYKYFISGLIQILYLRVQLYKLYNGGASGQVWDETREIYDREVQVGGEHVLPFQQPDGVAPVVFQSGLEKMGSRLH